MTGVYSSLKVVPDVGAETTHELRVTSRRVTEAARKRHLQPGAVQDLRRRAQVIEAGCFEQIETAHVSAFITGQVQRRGLAPKTANRYREILCRLFNWAMDEGGVRMPSDKNPVTKVGRYKEHAPEIRFLTMKQIGEQLEALHHVPQLQTMVAVLIYAGLRREELLWLTHDDVDLKSGTFGMLRIRAKTIDDGTGQERRWQPKTARNRAVPISSTLRRYLERYPRRIVHGGWLFPSPAGTWWEDRQLQPRPRRPQPHRRPAMVLPRLPPHVRLAIGDEGRVAVQDQHNVGELARNLS